MPTQEPGDENLRRERERLTNMLEAAGMCAWEWDPQTDRVTLSHNPRRLFGLPDDKIIRTGEDFFSLIHPDDRERVQRSLMNASSDGHGYGEEFRLVRPDGEIIWVADRGLAALGRNGHSGPLSGVLVDITDRKRAEDQVLALNLALRQRAEELQAVLDVLPVGIFIANDPECSVIKANPAGATMLGLPPNSNTSVTQPNAHALPFQLMRNEQPLPERELPMQRAARTGECIREEEVDVHRSDGEVLRLLEYVTPLFDEAGNARGSVGAFIDITERRRAEQVLAEREAEFRAIFALAGVGMAQVDVATQRFSRVNRRLCEITGYSEAELRERCPFDLNFAEDDDRDRALVAPVFRGEKESWETESRYVRKDGRVVWVVVSGRLVRDAQGQPQHTIATILDITDRRLAEEALREADRRKDEFLAMLAHELRNPLAPIRTSVEVLQRLGPQEPRLIRAREIIGRQVSHMVHLIDDLLDVSRISRGKVLLRQQRIDVCDLVRTVAEDHRASFTDLGLALNVRVPNEPAFVTGDHTRLAQSVGNLLSNSAKFTDRGGRVTLTVQVVEKHAVIEVADTGIGMAPELLPRVFEPFSQADSTIDRSRGGLGLGLALVRGLIELHDGSVEASSSGPGLGARFTIRLPLKEAVNAKQQPRRAPADSGASARKILVIEDNRDAADTLAMFLEALGHRVWVAYEGATGLTLAEQARPDLVICDIGLPGGLDGYGVASSLRVFLPHTYLIALTGYGQAEDKRQAAAAGFHLHLTKPVELKQLEQILRDAPRARTEPSHASGASERMAGP